MSEFKVILLGDPNVGKTSVLLRWYDGRFRETVSEDIDTKVRTVKLNGVRYSLVVSDTQGQERFRTLTSSYYRNADAVIMIFDLADLKSYDNMRGWCEEVERYCPEALLFIVGNKADKSDKSQARRAKADFHPTAYYEVSAKSGVTVDAMFHSIAASLAARYGGASVLDDEDWTNTPDSQDASSTTAPAQAKCSLQ